MLENQFIQFTDSIDPLKAEVVMQTRPNEIMRFFVPNGIRDIAVVTPDGTLNKSVEYTNDEIGSVDGVYELTTFSYKWLAPQERYRIRVTNNNGDVLYSNLLVNDPDANLSMLDYHCKQSAFGFPFGYDESMEEQMRLRQAMPIQLYNPQYKQEDKVYTKRNGEQVVLFASITKEYEGETDYIPMDWHEKILMALSCDEVYINGERVTKSNTYEIDHENVTYTDCGIKLMRATFKVTTNVTQRNSNY